MIEVFKLVKDMCYFDDKDILKFREESITRGNGKKTKPRAGMDVRKYSFSNRVVDVWNSLPDYVISVNTVFLF